MQHLAELRTLIARHATDDMNVRALPGIRLIRSTATTLPMHHVHEPAVGVIAQGAKRTLLNDRLFEYDAGKYMVVSIDLPACGHVCQASPEEPYLGFSMTLKPALIATLLIESATHERAPADPAGMAVSTATPELLDPMVRMVRLLDQPRDIGVLAPMIEREILWRLLAGEQGATVRQIGMVDSRLSQIKHAIGWIRTHYADAMRIEELADMAAMSVSSFHRHFRAVTAMSPLQYQKQIRLQEARTRLLAQAQDVAAVGFGVGYDSPSQFSREYSRLFGAPPGRDIARLRTLPAPTPELA
jgi:AraC-like DNA-binding protein